MNIKAVPIPTIKPLLSPKSVEIPVAASLAIHLVVFAGLAWIVGESKPVTPPSELLCTTAAPEELEVPDTDLSAPEVEIQQEQYVAMASLETETPSVDVAGTFGGGDWHELVAESQTLGLLGIGSGELRQGLGDRGAGTGAGGRGEYQRPFESLVDTLRRDGLDLVIVFDSTSSMGAEIRMVKARVLQIGQALLNKIPDTRIGFVTYKDITDPPVAVGVPLTSDLEQLHQFLSQVIPSGGGPDIPEAVHVGLDLAVTTSSFRPRARKVILLFGDAPPRPHDLPTCLAIAQHFRSGPGGKISTVTCRLPQPLPQMFAIAQAGGGEAHVLYHHERILDELLVLVFGGQFRGDVYRFFELGSG